MKVLISFIDLEKEYDIEILTKIEYFKILLNPESNFKRDEQIKFNYHARIFDIIYSCLSRDTSSLDCINDNYISLIYNTRNSDLIECIMLSNFFSLDELQECIEYFIDYDTVDMYQLNKLYLCVQNKRKILVSLKKHPLLFIGSWYEEVNVPRVFSSRVTSDILNYTESVELKNVMSWIMSCNKLDDHVVLLMDIFYDMFNDGVKNRCKMMLLKEESFLTSSLMLKIGLNEFPIYTFYEKSLKLILMYAEDHDIDALYLDLKYRQCKYEQYEIRHTPILLNIMIKGMEEYCFYVDKMHENIFGSGLTEMLHGNIN